MKRFWTEVGIRRDEAGFAILLDGRPMHLPTGGVLRVGPSALAEAIAAEWRTAGGAKGGEMSFADTPLTRLAGTAQERIAPDPFPTVDAIARYGESDLLCYRAETPRELVERQNAFWNPWLDWAHKELGLQLRVASGIVHVEQDHAAVETMRQAMDALDSFAIAALHPAVTITGSAVLGLAFARRLLNHEEALAVSCVDEDYQAERWGRDAEAGTVRKNRLAELALARRLLDLLAS